MKRILKRILFFEKKLNYMLALSDTYIENNKGGESYEN
jgi:hypothetical protein